MPLLLNPCQQGVDEMSHTNTLPKGRKAVSESRCSIFNLVETSTPLGDREFAIVWAVEDGRLNGRTLLQESIHDPSVGSLLLRHG